LFFPSLLIPASPRLPEKRKLRSARSPIWRGCGFKDDCEDKRAIVHSIVTIKLDRKMLLIHFFNRENCGFCSGKTLDSGRRFEVVLGGLQEF
jgi:hypothetical protein